MYNEPGVGKVRYRYRVPRYDHKRTNASQNWRNMYKCKLYKTQNNHGQWVNSENMRIREGETKDKGLGVSCRGVGGSEFDEGLFDGDGCAGELSFDK